MVGGQAAVNGTSGGVLNAFRHQRSRHARAGRADWIEHASAQRLSASTKSTRDRRRRVADGWSVCSTPFGINGMRHCGRRLRRDRDCRRAQRLSASTESTHRRIGRLAQPRVIVLNAFRHQRNRHTCTASCIDAAVHDVLNAFRHQRNGSRPGDASVHRCSAWCSTPFGINGTDTRPMRCGRSRDAMCSTPFGINGTDHSAARPRVDQHVDVLNAFRHQRRSDTRSDASNAVARSRCSTPFGINGTDTRR